MGQGILEIKDLRVSYGAVQALRGVSLDVKQGEIVTLLGSNGAGKSSLLRSIIAMTPSPRGEILFEGQSVLRQPTDSIVKSGISLVPEGRGILATMSVEENLELGAFHQDKSWKSRLPEIFELFPIIQQRLKQSAGTLSGGEQQMLAIGRALLARPKLLLLDEPSLGLAPKIIQNIFALISRIRAAGVSILLIEQNVHMGLKVADRAYVLQNGKIVVSGTAAEMRDKLDDTQKAYLGG
jgi:branched-chain amino acid transport system ATP-binding protein